MAHGCVKAFLRQDPRCLVAAALVLLALGTPLANASAAEKVFSLAGIPPIDGEFPLGEFAGDGGPASLGRLNKPAGVAVGPQGTLYIADAENRRVRRVSVTGILSTVAGDGQSRPSGDGGDARDAGLGLPLDVDVGPDGSIYIADAGGHQVRRIDHAGSITTVAGSGLRGFSGDGGPATAARLSSPSSIAVTPTGGLLVADTGNNRVRLVTRAGVITTVAGNGAFSFGGDHGPATDAELAAPTGIAPRQSGGFLIADSENNRIRYVDPAGEIATVAGDGRPRFRGDGGLASAGSLHRPIAVEETGAGGFLVADSLNNRIRSVSAAGMITTAVGSSSAGDYAGDGRNPSRARLRTPNDVALLVDGSLVVADTDNHLVRFTASEGSNRLGIAILAARVRVGTPRLARVRLALTSRARLRAHVLSGDGVRVVRRARIRLRGRMLFLRIPHDLPAGNYRLRLIARRGRRATACYAALEVVRA